MEQLAKDSWVYVFVQNPGTNEQIVGQQDGEHDISFIPTFLERDEALKCFNLLVIDKAKKYEVHAILYEELLDYASTNGFILFILNGSGQILDKAAA